MSHHQPSTSGSGRKPLSGNSSHMTSTHAPSSTVLRGHAKSNLSGVSSLPSTLNHTHIPSLIHAHPSTSHTHAANSKLTSGVHTHGTTAHITTGAPTHVRYDSTRDYSSANTRHVYSPQSNDLSEMKSSGIRVVYGDKVERYSNPKERGSSHTHVSEHSTRVVSNNPLNTRVAGHVSYPSTHTHSTATNLKPSSAQFKKDDNVTRTYVVGKDGVRYEKNTGAEHPGRSQNSNIYSNEPQVKYIEKKVEVEKIVYQDKIVEKVVADPKVVEALEESKKKEEHLKEKLEDLKNLSEENTEMGHHFASSTTQLMIQIERVKAQNKLIVAGYGHLVGNALLEESFNSLERKYNQLEVKNKGLEAHGQELELRMGSMTAKNEALKAEVEEQKHRIEQSEESMTKLANDKEELKEEVKELKDEKSKLKHQNDKDEKEMMELTRKLSATQGDKEEETSEMQDMVKKLQEENQNDKKTMVNLAKQMEDSNEAANKLYSENEGLKAQILTFSPQSWSGCMWHKGRSEDDWYHESENQGQENIYIDELNFSSNAIQGNGEDANGEFNIEGVIGSDVYNKHTDKIRIDFKKTYINGDSKGAIILYEAALGKDKMMGRWEVEGNDKKWGEFRLSKGLHTEKKLRIDEKTHELDYLAMQKLRKEEKKLRNEEKTSEAKWDDKMGAVTEQKTEKPSDEGTDKELSRKLMVANTKLMMDVAKAGVSGGGNSGSGQNMSDKVKNLESAIGQNEGAVNDLKNIELRYSQLQSLYENTLNQYRGVLSKILK